LLGHFVGWNSAVVGVTGFIFHLDSRFFREETLESLVYADPFGAPLAYTGSALLLIMNRMVDAESTDWPYWVLFLVLGGFVGNFIFSLTDHAQNGFFYPSEWVPAASSAFAVGFLMVPFLVPVNCSFLAVCAGVMLVQAAVGLLGFWYYTAANLRGPAPSQFDNFVYGAPAMAPLLSPTPCCWRSSDCGFCAGMCRRVTRSGRALRIRSGPETGRINQISGYMTSETISINRAPVLTLWAADVAQRLGFTEDEALTLGKAVAGLNAQAKGRRLGIFKPHEEKAHKAREKEPGKPFWIEVCGRPLPAANTDDGIRAVQKSQSIDPDRVRRYLEFKFGDDLKAVRSAMQKLAEAYKPQHLAHDAYALYALSGGQPGSQARLGCLG
jgi:hypothetical protein